MTDKTLFQRIADKEIPARLVYEDDTCIAFHDINPQAPVHILVVPRKPIPTMNDVVDDDSDILGHLLLVTSKVARSEKLARGYRIVINCGPDGQQSVDHIHVHLLGGRPLSWPPG